MTRVAVFPELVSCEVVESTQFHLAPLAPCLQYISAVLGFELQCCGLVGMCLYKSLYSVINGTWWTPGGGGGGGGGGGVGWGCILRACFQGYEGGAILLATDEFASSKIGV